MDLERVKRTYKWDPKAGDYSKSYVSYERRLQRKKQLIKTLLTILYIIILIAGVVIIFKESK